MFEITKHSEVGDVCSGSNFGKMVVIVFYADWNEHSLNYVDQFQCLTELSPIEDVVFAKCDADKVALTASKFQVNSIPTVVVTETRRNVIKKFENVAPVELIEELNTINEQFKKDFENERVIIYKKIEELLSKPGIIAFITGTPTEPECGFTRQLVEVFKNLEVMFDYVNTEADLTMLHFIRHFSKWPTFPQVFINGKLIGGLDSTRQKLADGTLVIPEECKIANPKSRLEVILNENKAIAFLDGKVNTENLSEESKKIVDILQKSGIKFSCFDLNIDLKLKEYIGQNYSKDYVVFFADKKFVGDLKKVEELNVNGQLLQTVPGSEWILNGEQKIQYLLRSCEILVFIHGIPKDPQSEQSKQVIQHLENKKIKYDFYNVDADLDVKNALIDFAKNDTIPLLYINQKLIGGFDQILSHYP